MIIGCKHFGSFISRSLKYGHQTYNKLLTNNHVGTRALVSICDLSTSSSSSNENNKSQVTVSSSDSKHQLSKDVKVTERIKQTTKDATNISVILLGLGIFSIVFYAVFEEFFSSKSPSAIFSAALKKCKNDPRVTELLGTPIKGHGEMTSRGRARHVTSIEYENNGRTYIRVKFYLKGTMNTATVQCETPKDSARSHFRYLFVEVNTFPRQVIVIEDNRLLDDGAMLKNNNEL